MDSGEAGDPQMAKLTVSLAQMSLAYGDIEKNHEEAARLAHEAARRGSQLLLLPELWSSGYDLEKSKELASDFPGGSFTLMSEIARREGLAIVGSVLERQPQGIANCAAYYDAHGSCQTLYRKTHLFRLLQEEQFLIAGDEGIVLDLPWCRAGLAICYDLRFPELLRQYALAGAELLILPAQWPAARIEHWRALLRARAIENQCFVIAANGAGASGPLTIGGHSAIIDPRGQYLLEGGSEPALLTAELDLDLVAEARADITVYEDRREDLYGDLQPAPTPLAEPKDPSPVVIR